MQFHRVPTNVKKHRNKKKKSWTYMYTTLSFFLGKLVIQINPSKFDERLCRLRLQQEGEIQDFTFWGREFQRDAPANDMLVLNKSSLGLGT